MKLSARDAKAFFAQPDPKVPGVLIHGPDPMRTAQRRAELLESLLGANAAEEMRLDRIEPDAARRDPALLADALQARGFFSGARAVLVEGAGDGVAPAVQAALDRWREGDACLVLTAGLLPARSRLRKLFEGHRAACAAPVYADPPGRDEVAAALRKSGLAEPPAEALNEIAALAGALDPGDFGQFVERLALYKLGDSAPVSASDIAAVAPATVTAVLDDTIDFVAEGRADMLPGAMRRLSGQGVTPVAIAIAATRHFRRLHAVACDPGGPGAGLARLRPPVFGPRRDRLARQVSIWGREALEIALGELVALDLALRSATAVPNVALAERALVRLAGRAGRAARLRTHRPQGFTGP
jgi:DNA polymerase-3 subunit delta